MDEAGAYDFREYPTAQFWNIAYGLMAQSVGLEAWQLKQRCVEKRASPILFGNALPLGIKFKDPDVHAKRGTIDAETARKHVQNVFTFDLMTRVQLVIASGLESAPFAASREAIRRECATRGIRCVETAFLFGPNRAKIDQALSDADRAQMTSITSAFLAQ